MNRKILALVAVAVLLAACKKQATSTLQIPTATVQRRDIIVQAEATGVIEPINVIEVKSKTASGQVLDMGIEVGSYVRPGDLIVQIDTTDLHTTLVQYLSDRDAAQQTYDVARQVLERNTKLFNERVITKDVLEQAQNAEASAKAALLRAETNVTLQLQKLKDSRVVAAVEGTILTKPVSKGQVIQAGGGTVSGGTVIATMADLTKVRARALVAETEIGQLQVGQDAVVLVDAFPDRAFNGTVEKIEPQAVVQQNVTMFPVLISLDNSEGLLRPGMNGEVNIRTNERDQVLAVPNDAIRSPREWEQSARALGLNPDSVRAVAMPGGSGRGAFGARGGNGGQGGTPGGAPAGAPAGAGRGGPPGGDAAGPAATTSRAELDPSLVQGGGVQGGGRRGGGRGQMPEVTDADCKKVDDALKAKPAVAKKLDDLRAQMRDPAADRQAINAQQDALYKELGVDGQVARACRFREGGGRGGPFGRQGGAGSSQQGAGQAGAQGAATGMEPGRAVAGGGAGMRGSRGGRGGRGARQDPNATPRSGLVFVQKGTTWEPRLLRLGIANYDFTEVISGVQEGEKVALMSAAIMQLRRQDQMDRTRQNASPLGGGGGGGPRGGGGGPGGGRGGR